MPQLSEQVSYILEKRSAGRTLKHRNTPTRTLKLAGLTAIKKRNGAAMAGQELWGDP